MKQLVRGLDSAQKVYQLFNTTLQDLRVGEKYRLERRIGSGSFGAVYLGKL